MQVQLTMESVKDDLAVVKVALSQDFEVQIGQITDMIDSEKTVVESDSSENAESAQIVFAPENKLNMIDQALEFMLKNEENQLRKQDFQVEFPPVFREVSPKENQKIGDVDVSLYCMQTAYRL